MRHRSRPLAAFLPAALAIACGGSQPEAHEPSSKSVEADPPRARSTAAEEPPAEKPPPAARRCSDGTCFACGAGFCLTGFYCDESTKGGAACSWLPVCAQKSGCGCLGRSLPGCKCEDSEGGPHVRCD